MSEISERYRALAAEFTRRVEAVADDSWGNASPCEEWTARDVLRHMLDNIQRMPSFVGIPVELKGSADDDPHGSWAEARDFMQDLLEDPERAGTEYDGHFGRTSLEKTVDTFLGVDLLIHGWDIARATGQDETLPPDHVERFYAQVLPLQETLRMPGVCGPAVPVPENAPTQDKLLGLLGRDPMG